MQRMFSIFLTAFIGIQFLGGKSVTPIIAQSSDPTVCDADIIDTSTPTQPISYVDLSDYSKLVTDFLRGDAQKPLLYPGSNIDGRGVVDLSDYHWLVMYFGQVCPKSTTSLTPTRTPSPTPTGTISQCPTNSVPIAVGSDINSIVQSKAEGTSFCIRAGVHRAQKIVPKRNQKFYGEKGAVLNGSKLLTEFTREGNLWVVSGQTQQFEVYPSNEKYGPLPSGHSSGQKNPEDPNDPKDYGCIRDLNMEDKGFPRCFYPEQLIVNDAHLKPVWTKADVGPGDWYFDYAADKIYFADDPTGKKVETSAMNKAFEANGSNSSGVLISNLIIEKYASRIQGYAVDMRGGGDVIVENNEIRYNHGGGVVVGDRGILRNNKIHHMGQKGTGGGNSDMQILNNEIAYNNIAGVAFGYEGGATKWARTDRLLVKNNYVHDNNGNGIWTDIDNIHSTIDGNISVKNAQHCIHHEISFDAVIKNNYVSGCGVDDRDVGILLTSSKNTEVFNNTVIVSEGGVAGILLRANKDGTAGWGEKYGGTNDKIYNNNVYTLETSDNYRPLSGYNASGSEGNSFSQVSNTTRFYSNSYFVKDVGLKHFRKNTDYTLSGAKGEGHEVGSSVSTISSPSQFPAMPAWNVQVGPR